MFVRSLKPLWVLLLIIFLPLCVVFFSSSYSADAFEPLSAACKNSPESPVCQEGDAGTDPDDDPIAGTVNNVANIIAIATAVVSVIVIIVAGISTVLSAGESSKVASARDAIIYAAVGMIVVAIARSIVVFIVNRL